MGGAYSIPVVDSKYYDEFCTSLPSMSGKVLAITGTTTGLGFVTARTFASKGGTVLVLNRPSDRAKKSLEDMQKACAGPDCGTITQVDCDLQSFESVRSAAAAVKTALGGSGLDILCNNAGAFLSVSSAKAAKPGLGPCLQSRGRIVSNWPCLGHDNRDHATAARPYLAR